VYKKCILNLLLCICLSVVATGQGFPTGQSGGLFGSPNSNPSDTTKTKFFTIFKGNPGKAALYSLVLPGAGQLYNKRWWKLPLVYALEGFTIYNYLDSRSTFNRWNNCYTQFLDNAVTIVSVPYEGCGTNVTSRSDAFDIRNRARNQKERAFLFMLGAHLFQTLEAFIDRHLIDFDVDEDLTFQQYKSSFYVESQLKLFSLKIPLTTSAP